MEALLRFKHWQIFMLTFGVFMAAMIAQVAIAVLHLFDTTLLARIVSLIGAGTTIANCCWSYIVATKLNEKDPVTRFNQQSFTTAAISMAFVSAVHNLVLPEIDLPYAAEYNIVLNIITLGIGLYLDYWLSKLLRSVELGREAVGSEFTGDFFAFLFLPIGVWWLQPRINRTFDQEGSVYDPDAPLDQHINIHS
jgi:hypothetical protein